VLQAEQPTWINDDWLAAYWIYIKQQIISAWLCSVPKLTGESRHKLMYVKNTAKSW